MNQYFENGIAGVEKRPINILDNGAKLIEIIEDKEKIDKHYSRPREGQVE